MSEIESVTRKGYPIEWIYPNSWNVNLMKPETFNSLKESIKESKGAYLKRIPIRVRKIREDYYEIIDGEQRWKACKELGFLYIPAIEENVNIEEAKVLNVILNRPERLKISKELELFPELKYLMAEWKRLDYRRDGNSLNELKQKVSGLKRELRGLWCDSQKGLVKCPACHGAGSFGDNWNEKSLDCIYCFGLGFVDQKTQMEYVRSFIGMEKELRELICAESREAFL